MEEVKKTEKGLGWIKKQLSKTTKSETNAFFWQIEHNSGKCDISLKVGRYKKDLTVLWNKDPISEITLCEGELDSLIDFITEHYKPIKAGETKYLPVTDVAIQKYLESNPGVLERLVESKITKKDVVSVAYRKKQLKYFKKLLEDEEFFKKYKEFFKIKQEGGEAVWQFYFEKNPWIFGYGLNYIFNSSLEGKKLEQVISGYNFNDGGKKTDALLKSNGIISSLCIVEIKKHNTDLLVDKEYRKFVWSPSENLIGGVQQLRSYVYKTVKNLSSRIDIKDNNGDMTGEFFYTHSPKAFLIVGSMEEFSNENGINEDKYLSFEFFRKNNKDLDIITFDELYERAKFITDDNLKNEE